MLILPEVAIFSFRWIKQALPRKKRHRRRLAAFGGDCWGACFALVVSALVGRVVWVELVGAVVLSCFVGRVVWIVLVGAPIAGAGGRFAHRRLLEGFCVRMLKSEHPHLIDLARDHAPCTPDFFTGLSWG